MNGLADGLEVLGDGERDKAAGLWLEPFVHGRGRTAEMGNNVFLQLCDLQKIHLLSCLILQ